MSMNEKQVIALGLAPVGKAGSNPTPSDVHVDMALTNVSVAYVQDSTNFIAENVFPSVSVGHQSNKYHVYNKNDFNRDEAEKRAPGAESAGAGFRMTTASYSADVWALHKDVDEQTRANADPAVDPENDAAIFVAQQMLIRREREWAATFFTTGVWATDVVGATDFDYWSDEATSDPITDVSTGRIEILKATGFLPNKMTVGFEVHEALKKHPLIKDIFKYTSSESITEAMLARVFEVDQYLVAKSIYATNAEGATAAYDFIQGKNVLLSYAPASAGLMIPSAGYTFSWSGLTGMNTAGIATSRFDLRRNKVVRVETEMAFDMKAVATDLGYFLSGAVE